MSDLGKNIDIHKIDIFNKAIGAEFKFVLRCMERFMRNDDDSLDKLGNRWDKLKYHCQTKQNLRNKKVAKKYLHSLSKITNNEVERLTVDLKNDDDKIGIRITDALPEESKGIFCMIVQTGLPICLWTRSNNIIDLEKEFDKILTWKSLKDLSELFDSVRVIREKALLDSNHLGFNLGLLCDNPERTPTLYSLKETGE